MKLYSNSIKQGLRKTSHMVLMFTALSAAPENAAALELETNTTQTSLSDDSRETWPPLSFGVNTTLPPFEGWTGPYAAVKSMGVNSAHKRDEGFCLRRDTLGFTSPDRSMSFQFEPDGSLDDPRIRFSFRLKLMPMGVKQVDPSADCARFDFVRERHWER